MNVTTLINIALQRGVRRNHTVVTASAVSYNGEKPLKRLESPFARYTALKGGVNETAYPELISIDAWDFSSAEGRC